MRRLFIVVHKSQGENRTRDSRGKLVATQHAKYFAAIHTEPGGPYWFRTQDKPSIGAAKERAEQAFGPLVWKGYPDYLGFSGVYAAAEVAS